MGKKYLGIDLFIITIHINNNTADNNDNDNNNDNCIIIVFIIVIILLLWYLLRYLFTFTHVCIVSVFKSQ